MNPIKPFILMLILVTLYLFVADDDYQKSLDTSVPVRYN
jgi:hypothetical protein